MVMDRHYSLAREEILGLLRGLMISYEDTLYVDANPEIGNDGYRGRRETPFLTIQAAVDAATATKGAKGDHSGTGSDGSDGVDGTVITIPV